MCVLGTKMSEDHLRDCKIRVLSCWAVEMHNRSEIEFHGLQKASVLSDGDIRVDHSSTESHEHMYERINGANRDKCKSHEAYPFSCI